MHLRFYVAEWKHLVALPELPPVDLFISAGFVSLATIVGAVLAGVEAILWIPAGVMFVVLLLLMTGDIITSYMGLTKPERKIFMWEREFTAKFLLIVLVVLSLLLDLTIYLTANYLPGDLKILTSGYLFVTFTTMLWLIAAEVARITTNVAESAGSENIPPTLSVVARQIQWLLRGLKKIDTARHRASDEYKETKDNKVRDRPERWLDNISDEDAEELAKFMMGRRRTVPDIVQPVEGEVVPPPPPPVIAKDP